jgi:hypothetical protein
MTVSDIKDDYKLWKNVQPKPDLPLRLATLRGSVDILPDMSNTQ